MSAQQMCFLPEPSPRPQVTVFVSPPTPVLFHGFPPVNFSAFWWSMTFNPVCMAYSEFTATQGSFLLRDSTPPPFLRHTDMTRVGVWSRPPGASLHTILTSKKIFLFRGAPSPKTKKSFNCVCLCVGRAGVRQAFYSIATPVWERDLWNENPRDL